VVPQRTARRISGSKSARNRARGGNALGRLFGLLTGWFTNAGPRDPRAALGAKGERLAVRRLRRDGYRIVARNFRAAGAEIDAIAWDGDTLVFVEVKTRLRFGAGSPEESVNWLKQNHIRRAAAIYARAHAMEERPMRFDVVAVSRPDGRWRLEIIKDAF
jgi:putative endonuclease